MSCHFQRGFPSCFGLELSVRFDLSLQLPRPLSSPFLSGQNSLQTEVSHSSEEQPAQLCAPAPRPLFCVVCCSSLRWRCRDADVQGRTVNVGCVLISFTPKKQGVMTFPMPRSMGSVLSNTCLQGEVLLAVPEHMQLGCPGLGPTKRAAGEEHGLILPRVPGISLSTTSLGVSRRRRNTVSPQRDGSLQ